MESVHPPVHDGADVTSWVSVCPGGLWNVQLKRKLTKSQSLSNSGDVTARLSSPRPQLGSLCYVRVQLKADTGETESSESEPVDEKLSVTEVAAAEVTTFPRSQDSVLQVPLGHWMTLRLGEGQCDVTEACVEGMRARETCEILLSPVGNGVDRCPSRATVELRGFTPGKESWEMSAGDKWEWVRSHKQRGGVRFRSGDVWGAADSYSRALKLLIALYGHATSMEEAESRDPTTTQQRQELPSTDELKQVKAELHSNLSQCQLKLSRPLRARANAARASELEPGGAKAWYRLGQACLTLSELEEARRAFGRLLQLQPQSPAALRALKDVERKEKETDAELGQRLSKMFS
ncbi:FK506-binding protein-like [Solea solea]|uniref:FK506-binding protein-like n=1 Tax=Solea solea TaxID=90069 RepID=UPI00272A3276|nr:FK506-binding protein-like [Solea solea]